MAPALKLFAPDEPARSRKSDGPPVTADDVVALYLASLEGLARLGRVSAEHVENVRRSLLPATDRRYVGFLDVVGGRRLVELRQGDLAAWISANPQWTSAETRRRNVAAVLACFRWACEEEHTSSVPYAKTRRLREAQVTRRDATDAEVRRLLDAAPEPLRRLLWFLDQTGARTCEARAATWADFQPERAVVVLKHHKTAKSGAVVRPRVIALAPAVVAELERWHAEAPGAGPIFRTGRGRKPWTRRNLDQAFRRLRERLGLPRDLTPYCLRHRFGTVAILKGVPERSVGDLMGHADTRTTRRYTHTAERVDHLTAAAAALAEKRNQ